jgi:hypothetical protein
MGYYWFRTSALAQHRCSYSLYPNVFVAITFMDSFSLSNRLEDNGLVVNRQRCVLSKHGDQASAVRAAPTAAAPACS